jgi:undecaprenyl diphosphate synthase
MTDTPLKHLAIIMDGNGRWAKERGFTRTKGHEVGAETIRDITVYCVKQKEIETATFYAFSTENWQRPKLEVDFLMKLLDKYLRNELSTYLEHGIKFQAIGDLNGFSKPLQKRILETQELTKDNTNLTQILALNYGGRAEITYAVNSLIKEGKTSVTQEEISEALQTPYTDIDLLIRTSGEERISNYLLWQLSYSEFFFSPTMWPDFTADELASIVAQYKQRNRRFGGIN